eukprot:g6739.t1
MSFLPRKIVTTNASFLGQRVLSKFQRSRITRRRFIACVVPEVYEDNFDDEVLKSELPVLIDFWATWCGPCKLLDPSIKWIEKEYEGVLKVVKIETDKTPKIIEKYKVQGLPTLLLFRDGEMVEDSKREGAITRDGIVEYLDSFGIEAVEKSS